MNPLGVAPWLHWLPWLAGLCAALAVGLAVPPPSRVAEEPRPARPAEVRDPLRRWRVPLCALAGAGVAVLVPTGLALPAWVAGAVACWVLIGRAEPAGTRRAREAAARDLPHLVSLLAAALRSGAAPDRALQQVCAALPGAAADRLSSTRHRLALGVDPALAWRDLADDPVLGRLGRTLDRAHRSGASVADAVEQLADEFDRQRRGAAEDAARTIGVRAAVPLGVCLLPAFLLVGVVPVVAGLMDVLT